MKVLIACEESQTECIAFRKLGIEAYSCDILPCSGGHPEWHIQDDVRKYLSENWDLIIAHPPCTYLSKAGSCRMYQKGIINKERFELAIAAREFFMMFYNSSCPKVAIENPVPLRIVELPPYNQIIQPYQFGDPWIKTTCLWLKNLPLLFATDLCTPIGNWVYTSSYKKGSVKGVRSSYMRSKSFSGIAAAMAHQWGNNEFPW